MSRAQPFEPGEVPSGARGVASAAPRATPLTIVSAAVAGDDLESVASAASAALGRPVAIALPALGPPIVWPPMSAADDELRVVAELAAAAMRGGAEPPAALADHVPIRLGHEVTGIVAALGPRAFDSSHRPWLEAAATAAAIAALMRESQSGDLASARRALIQAVVAGPVEDVGAFVAQARRLGVDLAAGAAALCAHIDGTPFEALPEPPAALLADLGDGLVLGLVSLAHDQATDALIAELRERGMVVARSSPRRTPAALHDALREAELICELLAPPQAMLAGEEETYRLLIGVLLRDPDELQQLRTRTVSPLATYDSEHDTELLATLRGFLAHHGSTTETAEAMGLHRHTVGYRLARVHEVSGLSPYESDGRERLSLGLKAHQILEATGRIRVPD
jgi:hypothetical protein